MCPSSLRSIVLLGLAGLLSVNIFPQTPRDPNDRSTFGWSLFAFREKKDKSKPSKTDMLPVSTGGTSSEEINIETDLVLSDLLVFDDKGSTISGLRADDFEVLEDGVLQKIEVFSNGATELPRSIFLVIDYSLSQRNYIEKSIEAAKVLVSSLKPADRMAIISDDVELISDLTSDKELLTRKLDGLKQKSLSGNFGKSRQYSALLATLLERSERNGTRQIVVFQTDGDEWSILRTDTKGGEVNFAFKDVVTAAERVGVTIYSVYTGDTFAGLNKKQKIDLTKNVILRERTAALLRQTDKTPPLTTKFDAKKLEARMTRLEREEKAVTELSSRSGGLAQNLRHPDDAKSIYAKILADIDRRYVIGYYPSNQLRDGKTRTVKISLPNRSGLNVYARKTYIAPLDRRPSGR